MGMFIFVRFLKINVIIFDVHPTNSNLNYKKNEMGRLHKNAVVNLPMPLGNDSLQVPQFTADRFD